MADDLTDGLTLAPERNPLKELLSHAYQEQGVSLAQQGNLPGAIDSYTIALSGYPTPSLYFLRGCARLQLNECKNAAEDFKAGLKLDPGNEPLKELLRRAYKEHGDALAKQWDLPGAIEHYTLALIKDNQKEVGEGMKPAQEINLKPAPYPSKQSEPLTALPPIHIVTQLWGSSYVSLFADYTLPSLMCEGNLPSLADSNDIVYEIHTTEADQALLEANVNFTQTVKRTENWIKFRFVTITGSLENPYAAMSDCHRKGIEAAESRDAAILFLQPDVITGDGTLRTVRDQLLAGKRLVMSPGLRAVRHVMEEKLQEYAVQNDGGCFPVRELVALAVENLHPISRALLWENGKINSYCSHLYWRIDNSSIYARCAHMHPLMVYPKKKGCGFDHTIDWDYFYRACPDIEDWFIASSSDEVCLVELSGITKFEGSESWRSSTPETVASFLMVAAEKPHLELLGSFYLFEGRKLHMRDWIAQNKEGEKVVREALKICDPTIISLRALLAQKATIVQKTTGNHFIAKIAERLMRTKAGLSAFKSKNALVGGLIYHIYCLFVHYPLRTVWRMLTGYKKVG